MVPVAQVIPAIRISVQTVAISEVAMSADDMAVRETVETRIRVIAV
jgi:hypothetical protein